MRWIFAFSTLLATTALAAPGLSRMPDAEPPVPPLPADAPPDVIRGARLYRIAACVGCHSPPFRDAEHLGGGRDLPTAFGTFYAPNISPDPNVGIGAWTFDDFERALHRGIAPDGHRYWPTFPYMAYTGMSDADVADLWTYLRSQPPVSTPEREHEIRPLYRGKLRLWRSLAFHEGRIEADPDQDATWSRGRYLVHAVGYCDQCHTPRNGLGLLAQRHALAGGANPGKGELHPNLTPDPDHGLGAWTADDIARFLTDGIRPDGTAADPEQVMAEKIHDSFAYLGDEDARAIAHYLRSLDADDYDPERRFARGRHASPAPSSP